MIVDGLYSCLRVARCQSEISVDTSLITKHWSATHYRTFTPTGRPARHFVTQIVAVAVTTKRVVGV